MNHLVLWKDLRLFLGKNPRPVKGHSHPVIQFVVAREGAFKTWLPEQEAWGLNKGLLIRPNHPHQCDASNIPILSLDIGPGFGSGKLDFDHDIERRIHAGLSC